MAISRWSRPEDSPTRQWAKTRRCALDVVVGAPLSTPPRRDRELKDLTDDRVADEGDVGGVTLEVRILGSVIINKEPMTRTHQSRAVGSITSRCKSQLGDGPTDGWMDRRMDGRTDGQT